MRSTSSESFKSKRRSKFLLKLFLILLAVLAGTFMALESRHKIFRIAAIEISPAAAELASGSIWIGIPRRAERFWPLFFVSRHTYEAVLESAHPVKASLRLKGWGRFSIDTEYLYPLFRLYWREGYWYVSSGGRMWLATLPDNDRIDLKLAQARPALFWDKALPLPFEVADETAVLRSSLPIAKISAWYENLEYLGWTDKVRMMYAGRKESVPIVRLAFKAPAGGDGAAVLFSDAPELWREPGMAVKVLYADMSKVSSDIFVDATYKGKIIVGNKVQ